MWRRSLVIAIAVSAMFATPANAISNGQIDGARHPNVGAVVFQDASGEYFGLCGSSLLSPTVLLTTAHCAADANVVMAEGDRVWVSFDAVIGTSPLRAISSATVNPYFNPKSGLFDFGVLGLSSPVTGITPVQLPKAGQLDSMKNGQPFTVVGYGVAQDCSGVGQCMATFDETRRNAGEKALTADGGGGVEFQMNTSATGLGGTCYGDGGDPAFIGSSKVEGAVQDGFAGFGAAANPCHSAGFGYRLDTPQARSFLGNYVTLP